MLVFRGVDVPVFNPGFLPFWVLPLSACFSAPFADLEGVVEVTMLSTAH